MSPVMDAVICSAIVVHSHIGFQYVLPLPLLSRACVSYVLGANK